MLAVGRWSKLLLSPAEGWEWRFQSKTVKSWEKAHFIQAEIQHRTGCMRRKKCTCRSPPKCKRERNPHPGPKHRQWGAVCEGDLEGWAAARCSYSRSHVGGLRLPPSTACPPHRFPLPPHPPLWVSCGDPVGTSWACRIWADPRKGTDLY